MTADLVWHPAAPPAAARRLRVTVRRGPGDALDAAFVLDAELARIRVPPPGPPRLAHDLWRHTCFELFVARDGTTAYHELNLAPSGAWGAFAFRAPRDGGPLADLRAAPVIAVRTEAGVLALDARVPLAPLSAAYGREAIVLGVSAVIEETDGRLSYWALHHPAPAADFHHRDGFRLRLGPVLGPGG